MNREQQFSVEEIARIVAPIARDFGVGKLSVFGSYARGDVTQGSDLDFHIIDRGSMRGLFRLAAFELALEEQFGVPVGLVTTGSLFDDVLQNIQKEECVVYEICQKTPVEAPSGVSTGVF